MRCGCGFRPLRAAARIVTAPVRHDFPIARGVAHAVLFDRDGYRREPVRNAAAFITHNADGEWRQPVRNTIRAIRRW